jgi:hypothetical protein
VRNRWVVNQLDYYRRTYVRHTKLEIAFETAARLAFGAAVATAVGQLIVHLTTHHMSHALILATFGFLVLAAFCEEYSDIQTYALTSRKYQWMAELFGDADRKLRKHLHLDEQGAISQPPTGGDLETAKEVLFELGCEALAENADWVVQHRQRPPTLPAG